VATAPPINVATPRGDVCQVRCDSSRGRSHEANRAQHFWQTKQSDLRL
jgi:hypothetical protein